MPKPPKPPVTDDQLLEAATQVGYEWDILVDHAVRLDEVIGARTSADNNAMEALLVHYRRMVNNLCGGYTGGWHSWDIQPADFVGRVWFPPDEELDRRLRGRLLTINAELQHLSWERVLKTDPVMWSTVVLAHEVTYTMGLFRDALELEAAGPVCDLFGASHQRAIELLPELGERAGTAVPPAPLRAKPKPGRPTGYQPSRAPRAASGSRLRSAPQRDRPWRSS